MAAMVQFDKPTLEAALRRYSMLNPDSTDPVNKKAETGLAKARQLFERVTGVQDTDNFMSLTWLTPEELHKPQQSQRLMHLYDESKGASTKDQLAENTLRTTIENARAIVYAAAMYIDALPGDNPAHARQRQHLAAAYQAFGTELGPLRDRQRAVTGMRRRTARQQANWASLDDIRRVVAGAARVFLQQDSVDDTQGAWLQAQQVVAACMYVLMPPSRLDVMQVCFMDDPTDEDVQTLINDAQMSNYVELGQNGPAIVINAHKNSRLHGELAAAHERTRRFPTAGPLVQTDTLTDLGFDVDLLSRVLTHYDTLITAGLGARNPHRRLFFVYRPGANVEAPGASTVGDRLKKFFKRYQEFGDKSLGTQMLRTITVSHEHRGDFDIDELEQLADWMGHSFTTAQNSYNRA